MPHFYPANGTDVTIHLALDASGTGFEDGTYSDLIFRFFDRAGNETDLNGLEEGIQSLIAREFVIDNSGPEILTWTVTGVTSTTEIDEDDYYNGNNGVAEHVEIIFDWNDDLEDGTFQLEDFIVDHDGNVSGATAYDLEKVTASQYKLLSLIHI